MIKINLLPRKPLRTAFKYDIYVMCLVFILNFALIGLIYFFNSRTISTYRQKTVATKNEIDSLRPVYQEYLTMENSKKELERRIHAINAIQKSRALAARSLYDLTSVVTDRLWLKTFKKDENKFELEGRSVENETISTFVESFSKIPYIKGVELKSIEDLTEEGLVLKKFIIQGNISL